MTYNPHPMQELAMDDHKVIRFRRNAIIHWMLDMGKEGRQFDLNSMRMIPFPREDWEQFMQQIGYSVCGYSELMHDDEDDGIVSLASVEKADDIMRQQFPEVFERV